MDSNKNSSKRQAQTLLDVALDYAKRGWAMAERLGVPTHLVRSTLEDIPDVFPRAFADSVPIYTEDAFARLRYELNKLEAKEAQRND